MTVKEREILRNMYNTKYEKHHHFTVNLLNYIKTGGVYKLFNSISQIFSLYIF